MIKLNQESESKHIVVIALGDPAGIGMEITLKALASNDLPANLHPVLVGCKKSLEITHKRLVSQGINALADPEKLEIVNLPLTEKLIPGKPTKHTGHASFQWLTRATELVITGQARSLVTAPIAKHAWNAAGHKYNGQTERLAELAGCKEASMLFTAKSPHNGWRLNTLLATTHIPLAKVSKVLSPELITRKLNILLTYCQKFKSNPKLALAGLNPHAGEKGYLGKEESTWLIPVLNQWKKNHPDIEIDGPLPPDSCWLSTAKAWQEKSQKEPNVPDGVLALYHDQGLIPMKLIAFERAVNTTLELPFIRTSPDHGTAFDIAGNGSAREQSMVAALQTALELS